VLPVRRRLPAVLDDVPRGRPPCAPARSRADPCHPARPAVPGGPPPGRSAGDDPGHGRRHRGGLLHRQAPVPDPRHPPAHRGVGIRRAAAEPDRGRAAALESAPPGLRRGHRHFWGLVVFVGLAAAFGLPLSNAITHLAHALPGYINDAEHGRGWLGRLVRRYNVQHWVQQNAPKLVNIGQGLAKPALTLGKGAFSLILELLTIFILILLLLLEGPKMRTSLLRNMVPSRAERYSRIARQVSHSVTGYMLGNFLTSITAGAVVLVTLLLLGVPFPFLWALWVALVDFLPLVGGALAGIPVVLFALGHSLTAGVVTLVVFLVYTQVENHILNPVVMSRTVKINPLLVLISILVGASLGAGSAGYSERFVAALLAIPTAGRCRCSSWSCGRPRRRRAVRARCRQARTTVIPVAATTRTGPTIRVRPAHLRRPFHKAATDEQPGCDNGKAQVSSSMASLASHQ